MTDKFFNSRYPIMEALMNGGSDLSLALAVTEAGAFPSYWYQSNEKLYTDIKEFIKCTGHANIVVGGFTITQLADLEFLKMMNELKISHIEILATDYSTGNLLSMSKILSDIKLSMSLRFLKKTSKLMTRIYQPVNCNLTNLFFDGYGVNGSESAGRTGALSVSELFDIQQSTSKNYLIPYGGIGTPKQVRNYIDRGAPAVAVGTLIAASQESSLSIAAKQQIIAANSSNLTKLSDTGQNTLILDTEFKKSMPKNNDHWNRQNYLEQGLRGNGDEGLLYIGKGVDYVTEIKPVKDIIKYLVSELEYK